MKTSKQKKSRNIGNISRRDFVDKAGKAAVALIIVPRNVLVEESSKGLALGTSGSTNLADNLTRARISPFKGVPWLFINDAPYNPYLYFFPVPVKEQIEDFANAGIHLYSWGYSSIIPHSMDLGWIGPNQFNYTQLDAQVQTILEADPKAYLFPRLAVSAPQWWLETHPDDRILYEDGSYEPQGRQATRQRYQTSMASRAWIEATSEVLTLFVRHIRSMPYADHFIGYQLTGGLNEWFYTNNAGYPDFSPAATRRFHEWLVTRYGNDLLSLREAWKDKNVTFDSATVPSKEERFKTDVGLLRDPSVSRRVSDYFQFFSEINSDAFIQLCKVVKDATNNENILGGFFGYVTNATGGLADGNAAVHWGHQAFRRVLESPFVDFICAPYQYTRRTPGGYDGPQSMEATTKLHGKLFITENDAPTFIAKSGLQSFFQVPSRAESFAIFKRDFSHRLITREGMWWMDLVSKGGWYHDPDIVRFLIRSRIMFEKVQSLDMKYQGEVAVVLDEESAFYVKPGVELFFPLVFLQDRVGLCRMGTTYDLYLHSDLERPDMPDYKLYIFLNTVYMTEAKRESIKKHLRQKNKVAVWVYAPGLISEKGLSADNMHDLTGISIKYWTSQTPFRLVSSRLYISAFDHPITANLDSSAYFGTDSPIAPTTISDDPDVKVLGRLLPSHPFGEASEYPAFVVKEFPDWKSIFVSAPNIPAHILRNIAKFAGCHVYNNDGDIIYANTHFVTIHTNKPGPKTIYLPRKSDVYDAFTEKLVARNTDKFTDTLPAYGTKVYFLGDISKISDKATIFEL